MICLSDQQQTIFTETKFKSLSLLFAISISDTSIEITPFTFKAFGSVWLIQQSLMVLALLLLQEMKKQKNWVSALSNMFSFPHSLSLSLSLARLLSLLLW